MVAGFVMASVYAVAMLRGRRDRYHRLGFLLPFTVAALPTPVQIVVGDWAAHFVADDQPVKLAAMEGLFETERGAPLHIGGIYFDDELRYALEIPNGLSLLATSTRTPRSPVSRRCLPTSGRRSTSCTCRSRSWSGWGSRCSAWRPGSAWPGGASRPAALALVPARRRAVRGRRRRGAGGRAGSPPRSAANRGSSTASSAPRTRSTRRPGWSAGFVLVAIVYAVLTVATVYVLRRLRRTRPSRSRRRSATSPTSGSCRRSPCRSRRSCSSSVGRPDRVRAVRAAPTSARASGTCWRAATAAAAASGR